LSKLYSLSPFYDEVSLAIQGVSQRAMEHVVGQVIREFCRDSGAWVRQLPPMTLRAGRTKYYLDPQPDSMVLYIKQAVWDSAKFSFFTPIAIHNMDLHRPRNVATYTSHPTRLFVTSEDAGLVVVHPVPTEDMEGAVVITVCLTVKPTSCNPQDPTGLKVPDIFVRRWFDTITNGAIGTFMVQHDKPWSNAQLGQYYLQKFRRGIAVAREESKAGHANSVRPFVFPRWN